MLKSFNVVSILLVSMNIIFICGCSEVSKDQAGEPGYKPVLFFYQEDRMLPEVGSIVRLEDRSFNKSSAQVDKVTVMLEADKAAVIPNPEVVLTETGPDTGVFEGHTGPITNGVYGELITVSLPGTQLRNSFVCYKKYQNRKDFMKLKARIVETPANRIGTFGLINRNSTFKYQPYDEPKLRVLREKYKLDKVVSGAKDEIGLQVALLRWVRNQWEHGMVSDFGYEWDALITLERAKHDDLFFCTQYAFVYTQCALALGYQARIVQVDGHYVAEVWSNQFAKWVVMDPDANVYYLSDGVPQSALDLRRAWQDGSWKKIEALMEYPSSYAARFKRHAGPDANNQINIYGTFLAIVMRNNHLSEPLSPYDSNHTTAGYCKIPNLFWRDSLNTNAPILLVPSDDYTDREEVFNWPLNYVTVELDYPEVTDVEKVVGKKFAESVAQHDFLVVTLGGFTPWFDHYLVRINAGPWEKKEARFYWKLGKERNLLEAKSVNKMGIEGVPNAVEVKLEERKSFFDM